MEFKLPEDNSGAFLLALFKSRTVFFYLKNIAKELKKKKIFNFVASL